MALVGEYEIRESVIHHMKHGQSVAPIETDVEDPAALILDAVRIGRAGPFKVAKRNGDHVMLLNNANPLDLFHLIRAALRAT